MKKITTFIIASLLGLTAYAVPAKRGATTITLENGTQALQMLHGDEFYHWTTITDLNGTPISSTFSETTFQRGNLRRQNANIRRAKRQAPQRRAMGDYRNIVGNKKGLVILVNFSDKSIRTNAQSFANLFNQHGYSLNGHIGSLCDYFADQSYGKLNLTFDVVGPVTLPQNMSYYGGNDSYGYDKHPAEMAANAIQLANTNHNVDFSQYDWDNDGYVDQVYIIYAGYSEAAGASSSTIWPHEWDLESAREDGDGPGKLQLDGVYVNTYACSSELSGTSGTAIDGIGTACHEFSHCLGIPDLYDTSGSDNQNFGMDCHDLMDYGCYSNGGAVPTGYSAYERWISGWLTPIELTSDTTISQMPALNDTAVAYILYNDNNHNEYYLLENRNNTRWFRYADNSYAGHGLLITHCDFDATVWEENTVNNVTNHQRLTIVPADKKYSSNNLTQDFFPAGATAFTDDSHYITNAGKLFNANTDGTYKLHKQLTNITESNGKISFTFANNNNRTTTPPTTTTDPTGGTTFIINSVDVPSQNGISVNIEKGTGSSQPAIYSEQLRLYANNTITVSGSNITKISLFFTKQGSKPYADLMANLGTLTSGGVSTSGTDEKEDVWTGSASSVVFTMGTGQRILKKIIVYGTGGSTSDTTTVTPTDTTTTDLDPAYQYSEPTIVTYTGTETGNNAPYSFIQNNIKVSCNMGARTTDYFSCNAGQQLTFEATQNIKSISINGYVKKDFDATVNHGTITFVDASVDYVEADPVVVIKDINSRSVTISCVKQLRCYEVRVNFVTNTTDEINHGGGDEDCGDISYDYEPTTATTINASFDYADYQDVTAEYGYISLYMESDNHIMELIFMADHTDQTTGIPAGTYTIDDTYQNGSVNASLGGDDCYDYPSYLGTDFDAQGYYNTSYYLMSGTVTVSAIANGTSIVVNATTYNGSTINATYSGQLIEYTETAIETITSSNQVRKILQNGHLYIEKNGTRYNAIGATIK